MAIRSGFRTGQRPASAGPPRSPRLHHAPIEGRRLGLPLTRPRNLEWIRAKVGFLFAWTWIISYRYGQAGESRLLEMARIPLGAGFGLLSFGLAIAFVKSEMGDLAGTALAFGSCLRFAQFARSSRFSYGSADIRGRSGRAIGATIVGAVYLPVGALAILSITDIPAARGPAKFCYVAGNPSLWLSPASCFLLQREQVLPAHHRDPCSKRLWWLAAYTSRSAESADPVRRLFWQSDPVVYRT